MNTFGRLSEAVVTEQPYDILGRMMADLYWRVTGLPAEQGIGAWTPALLEAYAREAQRRIGVDLPLEALASCRTPDELARVGKHAFYGRFASASGLYTLRESPEDRRAVCFVHPLGGAAFPFAVCTRDVPVGHTVLALEMPGLHTGDVPTLDLGGLAQHHADVLEPVAHRLPLTVVGVGMNGSVALEAARALQARGAPVELGLVEVYGPDLPLDLGEEFVSFAGGASGLPGGPGVVELQRRGLEAYRPSPSDLPTALVRAEVPCVTEDWGSDGTSGWSRIFTRFAYRTTPGQCCWLLKHPSSTGSLQALFDGLTAVRQGGPGWVRPRSSG